jgi:small subunit ribosomal protein S16
LRYKNYLCPQIVKINIAMVKIRLARHGRSKRPFYHVVVADSRAPRDGKFIEKLGVYNPLTDPATIDLNFEKALSWLQKGAQPTDTARTILSHEGVLMKDHLLRGVKKGALTEAQAEVKFEAWKKDHAAKIATKKLSKADKAKQQSEARLADEVKVREKREQAIAAKRAEKIAAANPEATAPEAPVEE